jgi:hypothetical protein
MTLAKMAKESNIKKGFKNRRAFEIERVIEMDIYAFADSKDKNVIKTALSYVLDGGVEKILYGNTEAESKYLETIFEKWMNIKSPKDKNNT